jgi:hypothetical protein
VDPPGESAGDPGYRPRRHRLYHDAMTKPGRRRSTYAIVLLAASCGDPIRDDGALGETPIVLAMRARVIEDGPYAEGLRPPPPDRWRAEILPGDVVQVDALLASAAGELDLEAHDPLWYLDLWGCGFPAPAAGDVDECSNSQDVSIPCRIGRGASPRFVAPSTFSIGDAHEVPIGQAMVCIVVGLDRSTEECAARLQDGSGGLRPSDCAFAGVPVVYGPLLPWLDVHGELPPDLAPEMVPPEHTLEIAAPDAGPAVGAVELAIEDPADVSTEPRLLGEGDTIVVPVGSTLRFDRTTDPRDEQLYLTWDSGWFVGRREGVSTVAWYAGHPEALVRGGGSQWISAPDEPATFSIWAVVQDDRGNLGWARWTVEATR